MNVTVDEDFIRIIRPRLHLINSTFGEFGNVKMAYDGIYSASKTITFSSSLMNSIEAIKEQLLYHFIPLGTITTFIDVPVNELMSLHKKIKTRITSPHNYFD